MAYQKKYKTDAEKKAAAEAKKKALEDYIPVNQRVMKFYEDYPNGIIDPDIIKWTDDGVIVIQVKIYKTPDDFKNKIYAGKGHAYEKEGTNLINKTSALENCETSAVGRALANMGYEIKKSIASLEEMKSALAQQEAERAAKKGTRRHQEEQPKTGTTRKQATQTTEPITEPITDQTKKEIENIWFPRGQAKGLNELALKLYGKELAQLTEIEGQALLKSLSRKLKEAKKKAAKAVQEDDRKAEKAEAMKEFKKIATEKGNDAA